MKIITKTLLSVCLVLHIALPSRLSAQFDLDSGLVAFYPFNTNALDESGNGLHGTVNGATLTEDRFRNPNSAYLFDGVSDYISVPHDPRLNLGQNYTLSGWSHINSWYVNSFGKFAPLLCKSNSSDVNSVAYMILLFRPNKIQGEKNCQIYSLKDPLKLGMWDHWVLTREIDTIRVFVNGDLVIDTISCSMQTHNNLPLEFGRNIPGVTEYLNGKIDDIRIYNRTLSEEEIKALFNEGTTAIENESIEDLVRIFPNPSFGQVNIHSSIPIESASFYDIRGQNIPIEFHQNISEVRVFTDYKGFGVLKLESSRGTIMRKMVFR